VNYLLEIVSCQKSLTTLKVTLNFLLLSIFS
jgi:hypothetical protein